MRWQMETSELCINTGFEILKNLYFHIKALHWIVRQEGCWPLISSDQHPGDTVTRSPTPTGLPAGDHHTQLVIRYLAEPSAQYCCSPHIPRVMAHSWRWWFHTTWSLIVVHMIWVTVLIKSTQDQNQSSSPRDYREGSHALTMQPGNTELKQPPKVTQPACFTQAQKQLKTCCEKGTFHLLQNTALVTSSFARHSWKKRTKSGSKWSCAKPSIAQTWINPEHQELHSRQVPLLSTQPWCLLEARYALWSLESHLPFLHKWGKPQGTALLLGPWLLNSTPQLIHGLTRRTGDQWLTMKAAACQLSFPRANTVQEKPDRPRPFGEEGINTAIC